MAYPLIPTLSLPFGQAADGSIATVEQGTVEEVAQCVYAIAATPIGTRIDDMDFGVQPLDFEQLPADTSDLLAQVNLYEPAAQVGTAQEVEEFTGRVVAAVRV